MYDAGNFPLYGPRVYGGFYFNDWPMRIASCWAAKLIAKAMTITMVQVELGKYADTMARRRLSQTEYMQWRIQRDAIRNRDWREHVKAAVADAAGL